MLEPEQRSHPRIPVVLRRHGRAQLVKDAEHTEVPRTYGNRAAMAGVAEARQVARAGLLDSDQNQVLPPRLGERGVGDHSGDHGPHKFEGGSSPDKAGRDGLDPARGPALCGRAL